MNKRKPYLLIILALFFCSQSFAQRVYNRDVPPPGRLVDIGGYKLHLNIEGQGDKTIIIEAGTGSWSLLWDNFQSKLAQHFTVITYDRAGYGWSDTSPYSRTFEQIARELKAALDSAGVKGPYIMLGHSYGGFIARSFTKQFPDHISHLILAESAAENQFKALPPLLGKLIKESNKINAEKARIIRKGNFSPSSVTLDSSLARKYWPAYRYGKAKAGYYEAVYNETYLMPYIYEQSTFHNPIDQPLLVITAGNSFRAFSQIPGLPLEETNSKWMELQQQLLSISANSKQVVLDDATHNLKKSAGQNFLRAIVDFIQD